MDRLYLSPVPGDEPCAQLGEDCYYERAKAETRRYVLLLRKIFGPEPEGARLRVKSENHDFGTYLDVVCEYDTELPEAIDYAFRVENNLPATWEG